MEHNRYNRNNYFRRDYQRNPYDRGPPQQGRSYAPRRPYHNNYHSPDYSRSNFRPTERVFDARGREVLNRPFATNSHRTERELHDEPPVASQLTALEQKAKSFLHTVLSQEGIRSKLIFLESIENSLQTLQGTVDYCQTQMVIEQAPNGEFLLKIDKEVLAKGTFPTKQIAKNTLAEQAMEVLRKDCFYIIKKKEYEEVSTKMKEAEQESSASQATFDGSKAHQMMLKMGWGGKGLGINEQGVEKTVAETLEQNVSRQGLGTDDVFKKIHKLLEDYSKSDKMTLLRFDPEFTSEERAHIHKIANKFGLKSKSEGKGEQRRITVTKKLHRGDLVYNLLTCGLENSLYKLIIPAKFQYLWQDNEGDYDDDEYHPRFSN